MQYELMYLLTNHCMPSLEIGKNRQVVCRRDEQGYLYYYRGTLWS